MNRVLFDNQLRYLYIEFFGFYYTLILTLMVIFDLMIVIKYPFADKGRSMRIYEYLAPTIALVLSLWLIVDSTHRNRSNVAFNFYVILYSIALALGVISSIYAFRALSKPGICRTVRLLILKRHVT